MLVSVIIPAYNAEKTICRAVKSALNQTIKDVEVIVVDDGSTDNTRQACAEFENDSRFKYIYQENNGPASARNKGLEIATGEYIGFIDSDDEIAPEMYEKMSEACIENNADMAVCDIKRIKDGKIYELYSDERRPGIYSKEDIKTEIIPFCLGHVGENGRNNNFDWSVLRHLFKRELLEDNRIRFDDKLKNSEDCLFVYNCICNANTIVYLKNCYYYYNIISNSLTKKYLPNYWQQRQLLIEQITTIATNYDYEFDDRILDYFVLRCAYASMGNVTLGFKHCSGLESLLEYRDIFTNERVVNAAKNVNPDDFGFDWARTIIWLQKKQYIQAYFYYKDVYGKSKYHHEIRKVLKRAKLFK